MQTGRMVGLRRREPVAQAVYSTDDPTVIGENTVGVAEVEIIVATKSFHPTDGVEFGHGGRQVDGEAVSHGQKGEEPHSTIKVELNTPDPGGGATRLHAAGVVHSGSPVAGGLHSKECRRARAWTRLY